MKGIGFDSAKYIRLQSERIRERIDQFGGKLYLEFGGKLFDDYHASRVLPGFEPDNKIKMLLELKEQAEVVIAISAGDIEKNKRRGDLGITYDSDVMRLIDIFRGFGLYVGSIVLTQYAEQPSAVTFEKRMTALGLKVYRHYHIPNYPSDIKLVVSDEGFGRNDYVETTRSLIVVTAPGPGSGKMATCLSQLYHEHKRGIKAGYAKFETFPIWNLPLKHPVNLAYEAATADLKDVNMIDSFHLDAYGEMAVNYNRDLEMFPVVRRIIERITNEPSVYKSPTDMGVNRVGFGIIDDEVVQEASRQEIIRRYFKTCCEYKKGLIDEDAMQRMHMIMENMELKQEDRSVVLPARELAEKYKGILINNDICSVCAIQMDDGQIITGKKSELMSSCGAMILNAIKYLAGISDEILLISPNILEPMINLKGTHLHNKYTALNTEEILIALSISAVTNPVAQLAMDNLSKLRGLQAHSTIMLTRNDEQSLRKLGIDVTSDPFYPSDSLSYN